MGSSARGLSYGLAKNLTWKASQNFGNLPQLDTALLTVTLSAANAASTITNPTICYACNNSTGVPNTQNFTFLGFSPVQEGPTLPSYNYVTGITPCGYLEQSRPDVEWWADSTTVEILLNGNAQATRLEVNGQEILSICPDTITGTAQAGGASSITLQSGASSTSGIYNQQVVYITGGTGIGQINTITAYNGSTLVATMQQAWNIPPDSSSTYRVVPAGHYNAPFASPPADGNNYYLLLKFSGPNSRSMKKYRIENGADFSGVRVDSSGVVIPAPPSYGMTCFIVGDSFGEPTGTPNVNDGWVGRFCRIMGWTFWHDCVGGTGLINNNAANYRCNYWQRTVPPVNAWAISRRYITANGTFTITQGSTTTGSIATNASPATVQTAVTAAFGSGAFNVVGLNSGWVLIGQGASSSITTAMTIAVSGATGTMSCTQWLGDIAPYVPKDGAGNLLPFVIVIQGSVNDESQSGFSASYVQSYMQALAAAFPQAYIFLTGLLGNYGPLTTAALTVQQYLQQGAVGLPLVNGQTPFLATFNDSTGVGMLNGSTNITTQSGLAGINTDAFVWSDGTHPTFYGHRAHAQYLAYLIQLILQNGRTD
jgi:hypothetical protein